MRSSASRAVIALGSTSVKLSVSKRSHALSSPPNERKVPRLVTAVAAATASSRARLPLTTSAEPDASIVKADAMPVPVARKKDSNQLLPCNRIASRQAGPVAESRHAAPTPIQGAR